MKNWILGLVVAGGLLLTGVAQAGQPWNGGYGGYGGGYGIRQGGCYRPVPTHHHHTNRPNFNFWYGGYNGGFGGGFGGNGCGNGYNAGYGGGYGGGGGGGCFPRW